MRNSDRGKVKDEMDVKGNLTFEGHDRIGPGRKIVSFEHQVWKRKIDINYSFSYYSSHSKGWSKKPVHDFCFGCRFEPFLKVFKMFFFIK